MTHVPSPDLTGPTLDLEPVRQRVRSKIGDKPRILIVKLSAIGDCLVASPVSRALRETYPQSHIAWAVQHKARTVVEHNPYLDETFVWQGGIPQLFQLGRRLRRERFDIVIDLQGALKSAPLVALSGAPIRIVTSRAESVARRAANVIVPMPDPPPHAAEQYLRVASVLGRDILNVKRQLVMPMSDADRLWAQQFIKSNQLFQKPLVALNIGSARAIKQWNIEHFARLADELTPLGLQPMVVGGPGDVALAEQLAQLTKQPPFIAAGKTSLRQLGALLERCEAVVTADTGPMHIATAVGTPVIALFGPTDPRRTGPVGEGHIVVTRDLPCRPCFQQPTCQRRECLSELEAADVLPAILQILRARPGSIPLHPLEAVRA